MIMGANAVGGYATAIDRAPVERRYPVQGFLLARAASCAARAATGQALAWLAGDGERHRATCRNASLDGPGKDGPGKDGPGKDGPGEDGPGKIAWAFNGWEHSWEVDEA